jgi:ribulose-phosphate 3-epimerase
LFFKPEGLNLLANKNMTNLNDYLAAESIVYSPSLICLDLCNLENQVHILEDLNVKMLHVDIIDGYFSPSMPLGLDTVRALRKKTSLFFDVHLMANNNDYFINELLDIGVDQLVFHAETERHIDAALAKIHGGGVRAGIALKPSTPLTVLDYALERCDPVLLMLINPGDAGHSGEKQIPYGQRKTADLRRMIDGRGLKTKISLDGRISKKNIAYYKNSADIFVIGSTCLQGQDTASGIRQIMELRKDLLSQGNAENPADI